jgi:MHS family proline/betaine transporter-like MFS transporter
MNMTADASTLMGNTKPGPGADQVMGDTLPWRTVLAATIGNTLEWYDFLVYGFLAMTLARVFFPAGSELVSLFLSFGTFGVAAVARPIGGLILGVYADRAGRKAALTLTIFIMGLGTGLIAVAPPYASIGVWASLLIVAGRLLQGVGCGGEYGGATAILVESAPAGRRGLYGSWQTASVAAGFTLGAVATLLVSLAMTPAQLLAGGWRWPFAFGLLIVPVGVYVRSRLGEPDRFLRAVRKPGPGRDERERRIRQRREQERASEQEWLPAVAIGGSRQEGTGDKHDEGGSRRSHQGLREC